MKYPPWSTWHSLIWLRATSLWGEGSGRQYLERNMIGILSRKTGSPLLLSSSVISEWCVSWFMTMTVLLTSQYRGILSSRDNVCSETLCQPEDVLWPCMVFWEWIFWKAPNELCGRPPPYRDIDMLIDKWHNRSACGPPSLVLGLCFFLICWFRVTAVTDEVHGESVSRCAELCWGTQSCVPPFLLLIPQLWVNTVNAFTRVCRISDFLQSTASSD